VEQRLLLHRVVVKGNGEAVYHASKGPAEVDPHAAVSAPAFADATLLWAQLALDNRHELAFLLEERQALGPWTAPF